MTRTLMRSIPFVEANHIGGKQKPKTISIRLSETTSDKGAALGIANFWNSSHSPIMSCHYVVDEELSFQCVPDNRVAFSSKFDSKGTISINVCAMPVFSHEDLAGSLAFDNAARLTAALVNAYHIPVKYVDLLDNRRIFSRGGIMVNVRGAWPTHEFLNLVNKYKTEGGA